MSLLKLLGYLPAWLLRLLGLVALKVPSGKAKITLG